MNELIYIRPMVEEDKNFILNSWLKSYKKFSGVRPDVYFVEHHKLVHSLLERSKVLVASSKDDASQIYAYIVYDPAVVTIIHFVFVKQTFRGMGIAKALLKSIHLTDYVIVTHDSRKDLKHILKKQKIFNPYKAYGELNEVKKSYSWSHSDLWPESTELHRFDSSQSEY